MVDRITEIKTLVKKDKINEAFNELSLLIQEHPDFEEQLVLLQSRYYALKKNKIVGTISKDEITRESAHICENILGLLQLIKSDATSTEPINNPDSVTTISIVWLMVLSAAVAIAVTIVKFVFFQ